MKRIVKFGLALALTFLCAGTASAVLQFVASFEVPAVNFGERTVNDAGALWVPWDPSGLYADPANTFGVLKPDIFDRPRSAGGVNWVQWGYVSLATDANTEAGIESRLSILNERGSRYTLEADVGDYDDFDDGSSAGFPGYRVSLLAGEETVAEDSAMSAGGEGASVHAIATAEPDLDRASACEPLKIRLVNLNHLEPKALQNGDTVVFDGVLLDATEVLVIYDFSLSDEGGSVDGQFFYNVEAGGASQAIPAVAGVTIIAATGDAAELLTTDFDGGEIRTAGDFLRITGGGAEIEFELGIAPALTGRLRFPLPPLPGLLSATLTLDGTVLIPVPNEDGTANASIQQDLCRDADGDLVDDEVDNCPDDPNEDQLDTDGDLRGDACDRTPEGEDASDDPFVCADTDADACDDCTGGSFDPDDDGEDTNADGICDAGDTDEDGVPILRDNCSAVPNRDQTDADGDDYGNACDGDFNQDDFVGGPDFDTFLGCFDKAVDEGVGPAEDPDCEESDMNADGFVGGPDFDLFLQGFDGPPGPSGTAEAPAPAAGCGLGFEAAPLLLLLLLASLRRRKGRR